MLKKIVFAILTALAFTTTSVGAADQYPAQPIRPYATQTLLTSTLLGANGVFTSPWYDSSNGQKQVTVSAYSAQTGSFVIQLAEDTSQSAVYSTQTFNVTGGYGFSMPINIWTKYYRIVYTNGGTAQTGTFELYMSAAMNNFNAWGVYNSTPITLSNGQTAPFQFDQNGYLNVDVKVGGGGGSGGSTTTTTYPSPAPNPSPGATSNPLYSDTHGNLYVSQGPNAPGTTSTNPLYSTDPNNNSIAQDSNKNQGVYLAGSGEGTSSSSPMYFTDPNVTPANMDANKNLITVGSGPNSQQYVIQSYQGGMEIEGSTAVSTTAVAISMTNPYYKISLWNTGASPAYCNLTATATASITGGILLPASMSLPFEIYWKTSGASTVSCITATGTTTVQAISFR